ncbi:MAG: transporter substrate-binding domain-containing protein, partial [Hyphomicrobiales bacterium]|nr:transporter substrate-binding domain-containing protein [Hyphomicrobiales bacterium]
GQVALSVSAYAFVAIAVPFVYFRCTVFRPARIIAALLLGAVLLAATAIGIRISSERLFPPPTNAAILERTLDPALVAGVDAFISDIPAARLPPIEGPATLDGIRDRRTLRVGYGREVTPFTYRNRSGNLVGFDISYAYRLARDLHVRLELAPIEWDEKWRPTLLPDVSTSSWPAPTSPRSGWRIYKSPTRISKARWGLSRRRSKQAVS